MTIHHLTAEQTVARPLAETFAFFSRPENLARITPPGMRFKLTSTDREMRAGLRLAYRLRPLPLFWSRWVSAITRYDPPSGFVDVQERGPYAHWEHTTRSQTPRPASRPAPGSPIRWSMSCRSARSATW